MSVIHILLHLTIGKLLTDQETQMSTPMTTENKVMTLKKVYLLFFFIIISVLSAGCLSFR